MEIIKIGEEIRALQQIARNLFKIPAGEKTEEVRTKQTEISQQIVSLVTKQAKLKRAEGMASGNWKLMSKRRKQVREGKRRKQVREGKRRKQVREVEKIEIPRILVNLGDIPQFLNQNRILDYLHQSQRIAIFTIAQGEELPPAFISANAFKVMIDKLNLFIANFLIRIKHSWLID